MAEPQAMASGGQALRGRGETAGQTAEPPQLSTEAQRDQRPGGPRGARNGQTGPSPGEESGPHGGTPDDRGLAHGFRSAGVGAVDDISRMFDEM